MSVPSRAAPLAPPTVLPHLVAGSKSVDWWGMVLLILTEATLFAALLSSYFYLRFLNPAWPPAGIERPELVLPSVATVILLASSLPMHLADRGIRTGNQRRLRWG